MHTTTTTHTATAEEAIAEFANNIIGYITTEARKVEAAHGIEAAQEFAANAIRYMMREEG